MPNFIIRLPADHQALYDANDAPVFVFLNANPGSTAGAIATGTGIALATVQFVLDVLIRQAVAIRRSDIPATGVFYWLVSDFEAAIVANAQSARDWINNAAPFLPPPVNSGRTVADLAVDLGVHEAVAVQLAKFLEDEASGKLATI